VLRSGAIEPGEPTDVSMDFDLESSAPEMTGKVTLETVVTVDAGAARYRLGDMDLTVEAAGSGLPGGKLDASLKAAVDANLQAQTLQLADLEAVLAGLTLKGSVNGTKIVDAPQFTGELSVPEFTPREVMQTLDVAVETADAKALSSASATLRFAATQDSVSVEDMKAKLDDSTLDVNVKVSHFAQPVIRFAVALDAIDLDRYLAPAAKEGGSPPAAPASAPAAGGGPGKDAAAPASAPSPGAAASAGAAGLPVEMLRTLDVDGTVKVGSLKVANLSVSSFDATVKGKGGVIAMHPASASLYGGSYTGNVGLDARAQHGGALVVSVDERLEGIQAGPLVKDLTGKESVAGSGNVTAKLTTRSATGEDFVEHLNGDATLSLRDGAVKGVNIAGIIRSAYAKFKGQPAPAKSDSDETDFTSLDGKFRFVNGVLHDDLNAQSPLLRIEGKGQVDLVREQIDYVVTANIVGSLEGQGGKTLDELNSVPLPIRVKGSLADPGFSLDIAEVMKGKTKQEVKKRVDKETEKLKEKLGDDLGDKLKGLFK
jgi:AsmA protein